MSDSSSDTRRIARELASINEDLVSAINAWGPPTPREAMETMKRIVNVLQQIYPEPEWNDYQDDA